MKIKEILELVLSKNLDRELVIKDYNNTEYKIIGVSVSENTFTINIKKS